MPKKKKKGIPKDGDEIQKIEEEIKKEFEKLSNLKEGANYFPLLLGDTGISPNLVDDTFDELREKFSGSTKELYVIVDSGGGDIDSAYNLALLFRRYAEKELNFVVPRWAKSAATLLVFSGDKIYMSPIAELGPVDPQIFQMNPLEGRMEQFSPLHIESTLELIRTEFERGSHKLAESLMQRLQFPLTLGSFKKSLDIGKQYITKLLTTRMFKGDKSKEKANSIAHKLTEGYADHGFCIDINEAKGLGLVVEELKGEELDIIWNIHKLNKKKNDLKQKLKEREMMDKIKELPPELLDKLPPSLRKEIRDSFLNGKEIT